MPSFLPPGAMSPPTPNGPMSPIQRTLRRPMSMMTLQTPSSRASSAASSRPSSQAQVFRGTIHVSVRAKPEAEYNPQWSVNDAANVIGHATAGDFSFDQVYDGKTANSRVFDNSVRNLIHQVADGYNGTVFAYGMTGSGKTFSMQGNNRDPGLITRSVDLLYDLLRQGGKPSTVKVSYLEIYNERVCDLLRTPGDGPEITLRDDPIVGVRAVGLSEVVVRSADDLLSQIAKGDVNRRTSSTQYNLHSSRSHAVVQIAISGNGRQSMLYLCDLAGSERAVSQVERRKEGAYINKSLLTLGTVISRLSTGGGGHVPFRDSKLTRLLQPSLSGQALVSVLCTVQTSTNTSTETLNTLRFAARAKNIVVVAKRSSVVDDGQASAANERLLQTIEQLKLENSQLKIENTQLKSEFSDLTTSLEDLQGQLDFYMKMGDQADDTLESILDTPETSVDSKSSKSRDQEMQSLEEQNSLLLSQLAQAQNKLAKTEPYQYAQDSGRQDLLDEIAELKETVRDKNKIIQYLQGSNERRANLDKMAPQSRQPRPSLIPISPPQVEYE